MVAFYRFYRSRSVEYHVVFAVADKKKALNGYVQKAIREKNWSKVLDMVMNLMQTAETKFETGAERKEWVLAMVKASADTIDYDIDMDAISDLIDSLCNMSKVVNAPKA